MFNTKKNRMTSLNQSYYEGEDKIHQLTDEVNQLKKRLQYSTYEKIPSKTIRTIPSYDNVGVTNTHVCIDGLTYLFNNTSWADPVFSSGPAHSMGDGAYYGGVLLPDGRVVFVPSNADNVGLFDPSDDSFSSGPAHSMGDDAYFGGVLLPDGRVVFVPRNADNVGLFNTYININNNICLHPFFNKY